MIRTSFFQTEQQRKRLIKAAKKAKPPITVAELMRKAIDDYLAKFGL